MKTILVRVTREDIRKGADAMRRKKPRSLYCPLGQAVHRVDGFMTAIVWPSRIVNGVPSKYFLLPKTAKQFIRRFDEGKPVKPFSFRLKVP